MEASPIRVDLRKVLAERNPSLYARLPTFLIKGMEWIIHQDEINTLLRHNGKKEGLDFVKGILDDLRMTFNVQGRRDWANRKGRDLLFASNHPLGGLDGLILAHLVGQKYGEVKIVVNDLLMALPPIHVPVCATKQIRDHPAVSGREFEECLHLFCAHCHLPRRASEQACSGTYRRCPMGKVFSKESRAIRAGCRARVYSREELGFVLQSLPFSQVGSYSPQSGNAPPPPGDVQETGDGDRHLFRFSHPSSDLRCLPADGSVDRRHKKKSVQSGKRIRKERSSGGKLILWIIFAYQSPRRVINEKIEIKTT